MLQHQQAAGRKMPAAGRQQLIDWLLVRRIEQHEIEQNVVEIGERPGKAPADNNIAVSDAAVRQIGGDERLRAAITLDERDVRGASADGLDAERAGTGVPVEHPGATDSRPDDIEQRLSQHVRRRSQALPCRRLQSTAFEGTCDDAHL